MKSGLIGAGLLAAAFLAISGPSAQAVVYCKYVGVPKGCVARPGVVLVPAPAVVAPVPVARRAVVRPGRGVNLGGPVNRVGVR
ncbi:MAG: hypothetical protein ACO1NY_15100 [Pseudorhodoplanes sp.]